MSDEVDTSNDRWDWYVSMKVRENAAYKPAAEYTGQCLYCDASVPEGHRWCDADCRDGWQRENERN